MTDKKSNSRPHPETFTAQACHFIDPATQGVVPAVTAATTYARAEDYAYPPISQYSRGNSPTDLPLEETLAALEEGADAAVFGAGMAAATAVVMALKPGDRLVAHNMIYWAFRAWLLEFCPTWGIDLVLVDCQDLEKVREAAEGGSTRLIWIETPSNPLWQVLDIEALSDIAHEAGARLAVDSTCATPVLTRPLTLGADLVMHSATKYLNGHSDVLAGVVMTAVDDDFWQKVKLNRMQIGNGLGPFESWLLLRGLRTLHVRVARQCETALAIARHFHGHPKIQEVLYPGLEGHRGHDIARRQMSGGFGGMLSLRVAGGYEPSVKAIKRAKTFIRATSLGGVESLIEHRATIEGEGTEVPQDLLRLSVGLEHPDDLIADLEQMLAG
ncbi:trans-sulfuration enzyme family protein [Rhodovibrionaceae bacterium A322]